MNPRGSILLVDDDDMARDVLSRLLRRAIPAAEVLCAADGEAGLLLYRERRPGVLITDMRMLGMSGAELVAKIRETDAGLPVVVISGAAEGVRIPGATLVIPKIEFGQLVAEVKTLFEQQQVPAD